MTRVAVATQQVFQNKKYVSREYNVDLWSELKKRWMVGGVLASVLAAVLAPRLGAPGGNYMQLHDH